MFHACKFVNSLGTVPSSLQITRTHPTAFVCFGTPGNFIGYKSVTQISTAGFRVPSLTRIGHVSFRQYWVRPGSWRLLIRSEQIAGNPLKLTIIVDRLIPQSRQDKSLQIVGFHRNTTIHSKPLARGIMYTKPPRPRAKELLKLLPP